MKKARKTSLTLKDIPVIWVVLALLAVGAAWWSWSAHTRAEQAARRLRTVERTWRALSLSEPLPTAAVAEAWRDEREDLTASLAAARRALGAGRRDPVAQAEVPAARAEAFFALAQFVEAQRANAATAGVGVPPGTAFGFSAYANSGPDDAAIGLVHRQHQVVKALLETLWHNGARELTRVQREWPAGKLAAGSAGRREGRPEDYLEWPAARSLARAGLVDTLAVRVGFIGKTDDLRRYLNALAELPMPLVVRAVEVEPLGADGAARGGMRTLADLFRDESAEPVDAEAEEGAVPIIGANDAEFLVTVEYLDFDAGQAQAEAEEGDS